MIKNTYTITYNYKDEFSYVHKDEVITIKANTKELVLAQLVSDNYNSSDIEVTNIVREPNVGLAVIRGQCLHKGHEALTNQMGSEMDVVIIGMGSIQEFGTINNPWAPKSRRIMWEMLHGKSGKGSKYKLVELRDIGACSKIAWSSHVFGKIEGMNLPKPTHYYAGSNHDASWFESINEEFGEDTLQIVILDRLKDSICMSGTEIRKSILNDSDDWKEYVPHVLVDYIEETFPKELKLYEDLDVDAEKAKFEKRKG